MKFSGKITNSIITFMRGQGAEMDDLYETSDLPLEFLKDPTSWLDAAKVESFLISSEQPIDVIGHAAKDLKAWGVLDSVLRMITKPQDIFLQPQRFISYFIYPAPPIANIKREESSVSFDLPISFEEYPLAATYLCAAIEAVPLFMGSEMAEASWQQNRVSINWGQSQPLFADSLIGTRHMAPEVMQNLITTLEKTEQALLAKTRELEIIKTENALAAKSQTSGIEVLTSFRQKYSGFRQNVLKLQDYFTRSQQLITLLVGQDRMSTQVREAMRRVNWEQVQVSFPEVAKSLIHQMDENTTFVAEEDHVENQQNLGARDIGQPWLPHS